MALSSLTTTLIHRPLSPLPESIIILRGTAEKKVRASQNGGRKNSCCNSTVQLRRKREHNGSDESNCATLVTQCLPNCKNQIKRSRKTGR